MKRETIEKCLLLEQSGELGALMKWRLHRALRHSVEARAMQVELEQIMSAQSSADELEISGFTVSRIMDEGARVLDRREAVKKHARPLPFFSLWRPAVVYAAAALLLVVGISYMTFLRDVPQIADNDISQPEETFVEWNGDFDEQITELDTMLALASEGDWEAWEPKAQDTADDSESIARELLLLEGEQI
ncbi:MAG: hypothetical protein KJ626_09140 [Verrucomicrobia bacterium]|nr:hypothetical protein [Verrucomicrobiota bacterium]